MGASQNVGCVQRLDGGASFPSRHLHEVEVAGVELSVCGVVVLSVHLTRTQRAVVLALKETAATVGLPAPVTAPLADIMSRVSSAQPSGSHNSGEILSPAALKREHSEE